MNIKRLIKKVYFGNLHIPAGNQVDERILADALSAMPDAEQTTLAARPPNIFRTIVKSRIAWLTAGTTIVICVSAVVYMTMWNDRPETQSRMGTADSKTFRTPTRGAPTAMRGSRTPVEPMAEGADPCMWNSGLVYVNRGLDGFRYNCRVSVDGWIRIGEGVFWHYIGGKELSFSQQGPLIYVEIYFTEDRTATRRGVRVGPRRTDEEPEFRLAGVRLRTADDVAGLYADDIAALRTVLEEHSGPLTLWCDGELPGDISELPNSEKITAFQHIHPELVSDLSPLAHLSNLQALRMEECLEIQDISPLAGLVNLKALNLSCNPNVANRNVSDISPLSKLVHLNVLRLFGFPEISDLAPLRKLTNLAYLELSVGEKTDLTSLADLKKLRHLDLGYCRYVNDISPLGNLTELRFLKVLASRASDFSPLENLANLRSLNLLGSGNLSDISPLANLTELRSLDLSACDNLSDISPLANLVSLRNLRLWACRNLADLSPLAELSALEFLHLGACAKITSLEPLAGLTNLQKLKLNECAQISDLSPLSGLTNLNSVTLWQCPNISDLSPLAPMVDRGANVAAPSHLQEQLSQLRGATRQD